MSIIHHGCERYLTYNYFTLFVLVFSMRFIYFPIYDRVFVVLRFLDFIRQSSGKKNVAMLCMIYVSDENLPR